jgi:hypothetical protein
MSIHTDSPSSRSGLHRFFGGSPLGVLLLMALLSVLVGMVMEVVGLDPWNTYEWLRIWNAYQGLRMGAFDIRDFGLEIVRGLGLDLLLGAVLVVPIWFVMRLFRTSRGR